MPQPFKPKRIEIFSEGSKVAEFSATDSCKSFTASIGFEKSTNLVDCGKRELACPTGYTYYSGTYGACGPGCWKYVGGTVKTCGYAGWVYTSAYLKVVYEPQYRHTVTIYEDSQEEDRWESRWFCYSTTAQQAEYDAAKPTTTSFAPQWCPENHLLCGNPCADPPDDWCCLDCAAFKSKVRQLADAAEAIKNRILGE